MERRLVNGLEWLKLDKVLSDSQENLVPRPLGRYLTRSCGDVTEYTYRVTQTVFYAVVKITEYQVSSTVDPPCATSSHKLSQTQNTNIFPVKTLLVKAVVNGNLSWATATTVWSDSFVIFHCF